ncbi:MAG: hypothetical protein AB7T10_03540 [bacterium]
MRNFLPILMILFALFITADEPMKTADEIIALFDANLDTINDYTCVLHDYVKKGKKVSDNYWDYRFLKPKYIRMESFKGERVGSKAYFDCVTKKITGRQGGILSAVKLTLDLSNALVKNIRGTTIAESDWPYVSQRTKNILKESGVEFTVSKTKFQSTDVTMLHIKNIPFEKYNFDEEKLFFTDNVMLIGLYNYENKEIIQNVHYYDIKLNTGLVIDSLYTNRRRIC